MEGPGARGHVAGVGVLVDRTNSAIDFGVKQTAVLSMEIPSWDADVCPLCREGKLPPSSGSRTDDNPDSGAPDVEAEFRPALL